VKGSARAAGLLVSPGAVTRHWPEYAIEAACLGLFMISACVFVTLLEHPLSPARAVLADPTLRRVLVGVAMGLTAIGLIYSPWGQQSGAHMNPSLTLTYLRLGKIAPADAFGYVLAQFAGGFAGVLVARVVLGRAVADALTPRHDVVGASRRRELLFGAGLGEKILSQGQNIGNALAQWRHVYWHDV